MRKFLVDVQQLKFSVCRWVDENPSDSFWYVLVTGSGIKKTIGESEEPYRYLHLLRSKEDLYLRLSRDLGLGKILPGVYPTRQVARWAIRTAKCFSFLHCER